MKEVTCISFFVAFRLFSSAFWRIVHDYSLNISVCFNKRLTRLPMCFCDPSYNIICKKKGKPRITSILHVKWEWSFFRNSRVHFVGVKKGVGVQPRAENHQRSKTWVLILFTLNVNTKCSHKSAFQFYEYILLVSKKG